MKHLFLLFTGLIFSVFVSAQNIDQLNKLYSQKEFDQVISLGLENLGNTPDDPMVNMLVGRALADKKQYEKAIPFLKKGTSSDNNQNWVQAWSHAYLGRCFFVQDELAKSGENLSACIKLAATQNSTSFATMLQQAFQLSDFYTNWNVVESEHIRFHFQNANNLNDKDLFIKGREQAYVEINKFFQAKPYKKIDFYVWDDPEQAKEILGHVLGFATSETCIINSRNNQTRGHEITHILTVYGIQPKQATKFINEGIAAYFDQTKRDRLSIARESISGKEINLIDLWENPKNYPEDYNYTIGPALISHLFEVGTEEQMKKLLKDQTVASARNIYTDFDQIITEFRNKLLE